MNVGIGNEAARFYFWDMYVNRIFSVQCVLFIYATIISGDYLIKKFIHIVTLFFNSEQGKVQHF